MSRLRLFLLGSLDATLDGEPLRGLRSDRVRALLAYLVAEADRPHRRESLATLLWGEYPEKSARASLRVSLANLRQSLAPLTVSAEGSSLLSINRRDVHFNANSDNCWVDVVAFERLLSACDKHGHQELARCPACIQGLTEAVELYRDDFLLGLALTDSSAFDEWRLFQQERIHQQVLGALSTITAHHVGKGDYDLAYKYALRQVEIEPWREDAHRQLMTTLALSGQRAAALAQYESCRQVLAAELDTEPEIETTAIYEQIRSGTLVVDRPEQPRSSSPNGTFPPYALPAQVTPFIGRKKELTQIGKMLLDPDCRLLTIFGPGGIGKTRLALQAATKQIGTFRDGVYFIPVAAENSAETLLLKLAQTLRFSFYRGEDPLDQLQHYLREKNILLIMDGFEHLLISAAAQQQVAVALLTDILQNAPATKIVVVSRERLNVHGEWLLNIEGLTYPVEEATEDLERYSAIQLFVQSAHRVQPEFALSPNNVHEVIRICQLVEGMPLAIELATAWLRALTCREIAQEIQQNLDFLTTSLRDLPERHRNLRAVFDHSWELLSAVEQRVFCQLSVFQAGFSRDAAEAVTGVTPLLLVSLVDKSLLRRISSWRPESRARYGMHDLLKRYGSDQLGALSEEQRRAREKHSTYYLAFLRQREPELKGQRQRTALAAIEAEIDNIRVAWHWAIAHGKTRHIEQALESLFLYYYIRSWFQEGEEAFGQLVQSLGAEKRKQSRLVLGRALACQGWFAFHLGRQTEARDLIQQGLSQLRKLEVGVAVAFCLNYLGAVVKSLGAYEQAREACLESLAIFREEGDLYGAAIALNILGQVAYLQGHEAEAQRLYQESLTLHREIGDQWGIAFSLDYLGQVAFSQGAFDQAKGQFQESLSIRREMGDQRGTALCLNYLGDAAEALGEYDEAAELYEEGLLNFKEIGHQTGIAQSLTSLGQVTFVLGDYEQAQRRFAEALEAAMAAQAVPSALNVLFKLAVLLARTGDKVQAFNLLNFVRNHPLCPRNDRENLEQLYLELAASVPADAAGQVGASADSASLETMIEQVVAGIRVV